MIETLNTEKLNACIKKKKSYPKTIVNNKIQYWEILALGKEAILLEWGNTYAKSFAISPQKNTITNVHLEFQNFCLKICLCSHLAFSCLLFFVVVPCFHIPFEWRCSHGS